MIGYLIYSEKDIKKNKFFIKKLEEGFARHGILLQTVVYEQLSISELLSDLPDFVINRSRFHEISSLFEEQGIPVFNNALVTKIANDKMASYHFLDGIVPFMDAKYSEDYVSGEFSYPVVFKSCSGHGGSEVFLVSNAGEESLAAKALAGKPYLVQKCSNNPGKDVRVYILGNEIVAAVLRSSPNSFKSNYSLGGQVAMHLLTSYEKDLVQKILCKLDIDYAGIDFIFHDGKAVFNEIEDAVGARMLYEVSDLDIAAMFVEYVVTELSRRCTS
jgi:RimK family alpha-L-glutamate ligase